jgi:hypothetical protein
MDEDRKASIVAALSEYPHDVRRPVGTPAEITDFEVEFGALPDDVRWFLCAHGGGAVGREWLDGISELRQSQIKFQSESGTGGWSLKDVVIVGWDGAGNPIAVRRGSGEVIIEDHTFGGVHTEAPSFVEYLEKLLSPKRS